MTTTLAFDSLTPILPSDVKGGAARVPVVFLGRCRECETRIRVAGVVVGHWPGKQTWVEVDGLRRTIPAQNSRLPWRAECCGRDVWAWAIEATISEGHVCGAACRNAKGHSCECSCGGEHHGADA